MKFYSAKKIELKEADIHLHYANNRGRGSDNVTITVVDKGQPRESKTSNYGDRYRYRGLVSGWKGNVNVPNELINMYGGVI